MAGRTQYPKSVKAGVPHLGPCPTGWRTVRFGEVLEPVFRPVELEDTQKYELTKVLRSRRGVVSRGFSRGKDILTKTQFRVAANDFLISRRQIVHGACGLVPRRLEGAIVSNEYAPLRAKDGLVTEFLPFLSGTDYFQLTCFHCCVGVHVEKMIFKLDKWLQYRVHLPPIRVQETIAGILGDWETAIESTSRMIRAKHEQRKGLGQQLLTGRLRFPEFVRSSDQIETRYGQRPKDWPYLRVGDLATDVSARAEEETIPVLSCTKHRGLVDSLEYFGKRVYGDDTSNYKLVRRNQFAYATNHIEEGSIGLLSHRDVGLVSPMYTVFETSAAVHPPFLYALFKTELYRRIFEVNTSSSVNRRGGLRWADFKLIHLALPDLSEQRKIAEILVTCDREIELLKEKLEALKRQKKGLMQKLLTGEIQTKEAAA